MGALSNENPSNPGTLGFLMGDERILVSILTIADIVQRNRIIDTLLHLSSLRLEGTQPYIAAPRLLGATLDSQIFRSSGIGLLLYDERRIEETIKPEPIQRAKEIQVTPISNTDNPLLADLAALKSMYAELERNMSHMMAEFKSLRENALSSTSISLSPSNAEQRFRPFRPHTTFEPGIIGEGSLPSFFTNNPWLDVLSKRGRTEDPPLAG